MRKRIIEIDDLDDKSWSWQADLVREMRLRANLTQVEVATAANTRQSHVSEVETGVISVGLNLFTRIMRACGCSVKVVIERND